MGVWLTIKELPIIFIIKYCKVIEIFIATYVIFFMLLNFLNMFFKAISPKLGEYVEEEEELIGGTLYSK